MLVKTLYTGTPYLTHPITHVTLPGSPDVAVHWEQTARGLVIQLPAEHDDLLYALKIKSL
jgi:hypothetical protein